MITTLYFDLAVLSAQCSVLRQRQGYWLVQAMADKSFLQTVVDESNALITPTDSATL